MEKLQSLFQTIDQLNNDELDQIEQYIDHRRHSIQQSEAGIEARLEALDAALAEFREGLTAEEWDEVAAAMTSEYVEPADCL